MYVSGDDSNFQDMIQISFSSLSDPLPYNVMYICIATYLNKILFKPNLCQIMQGSQDTNPFISEMEIESRETAAVIDDMADSIHSDIEDHEVSNSSGPKVIKHFSCSIQLSMTFLLLINVKMPTIVGILTFMSSKNSILGLCFNFNSSMCPII